MLDVQLVVIQDRPEIILLEAFTVRFSHFGPTSINPFLLKAKRLCVCLIDLIIISFIINNY